MAKKDKKKTSVKEYLNKKAFHDYIVEDIFEVGIVLHGSEVKAIRAGRMNFKESFVRIIKNEVFILNMNIDSFLFRTLYFCFCVNWFLISRNIQWKFTYSIVHF